MFIEWFSSSFAVLGMVVLSTIGIYVSVIVLTRLAGLRSFSTMSAFDFAMTIAIGSIIASIALNENPPLAAAVTGLAMLYGLQRAISAIRLRSRRWRKVIDNEPILLMADGETLLENMRKAKITDTDLWSKLRGANVTDPSHVRAVVLETTGTVSVLHASPDAPPLDPRLLMGVRGSGRVAGEEEESEGA